GVDWLLFPILLFLVAEPLAITRSYTSFIIARNWGAVLASVPTVIIELLDISGILDDDTGLIVSIIVLMIQLRSAYLIASRALGVGVGLAVAIVIGDFAVTQMIVAISNGVIGLPLQ